MSIGYLDIIRNVYKVCCRKLQHGEKNEIFIFGFSRGACKSGAVLVPYSDMVLIFLIVIARAVASFLQYVGLIKEEFLDKDEKKEVLFKAKFHELLNRYGELTKKPWWGVKVHDTPLSSPPSPPSPSLGSSY